MAELRTFLRLLARQRVWLGLGTLLTVLGIASSAGLLALSGWLIALAGLSGGALALAAAPPAVLHGIRGLALTRGLCRYGERLVNHSAVFRILADLRLWLFTALLRVTPPALARLRDGELLNRITTDIDTLDHLYLRVIGPSLAATAGFLLAIVLLAWLAPGLLPPLLLILLPAAIGIPWLSHRRARRLASDLAADASRLREQLIADLASLAELQVYGVRRHRRREMLARARAQLDSAREVLEQGATSDALLSLALWLTLAASLWLAPGLLEAGSLDGAGLAGAVLGLLALGELLAPLPQGWQMLGRVQWSAQRLTALTGAGDDPPPAATRQPLPGDNTLHFQAVCFRHRADQPDCLHGLTLRLAPGEHVGILGPSGSGKSSLLALSLAERAPDRGRVCLGGVDLADLDPTAVAGRMALLEQRSVLFSGSIADNLRLAADGIDTAQLESVLAAVALDRVIAALPEGLDTRLGAAGSGLSGGQARRLALARTLLKPAAVVLLDEPTEGLDRATEQRVLAGIDAWTRGRSLLMIGHDPHRFPPLDRLYRLHAGRLEPMETPR